MTNTNNEVSNRSYSIGFSLIGSLIIILFFVFINYSTGMSFPWFIFPAYAALWWPIVTILRGKRSTKMLSLIGSLTTIALLVMINYLTTPSAIWFYYPVFVIVWWPLSVFLTGPKTIRVYSVLGSLITISFLTLENIIRTPNCPWVLLTYFPLLMWPVGVLLGKRLGKLSTALVTYVAAIVTYSILNLYVFKGFPWIIFPAYALLWWPLAIAFAKRGRLLIFSVIGSLLSAVLFVVVNLITTPDDIWAVYPIFAILWWPLSTYYFVHLRQKVEAPKY